MHFLLLGYSCPEAYAMIYNISKHIDYIESTIAYLDCRVKRDASMLEYGQSAQYNVKRLWEATHKAMEYNLKLHNRLKYFASYLEQLKDHSEHQLPDLITGSTAVPGEDVVDSFHWGRWRKQPRRIYQNRHFKVTAFCVVVTAGVGSFLVWRMSSSNSEESFLSQLTNKIAQFLARKQHSGI